MFHGALPKLLSIDTILKDQAMAKERALGYFLSRYREAAETFDKQEIIALDQLWFDAVDKLLKG